MFRNLVGLGSKIKPAEPYLQYSAKARLYEYKNSIMVCSVRWIAETDSITVFDSDVTDHSLGLAVQKHLAEYDPSECDLRGRKLTDWTAFKASGARSIKSFEENLWCVNLAIMNSAILIAACPNKSRKQDVTVSVTASKSVSEQIGAAIREAIAGAKMLREQGFL